jgi:hypothetical protein
MKGFRVPRWCWTWAARIAIGVKVYCEYKGQHKEALFADRVAALISRWGQGDDRSNTTA